MGERESRLLLAFVAATFVAPSLQGQDFRVETDVFVGDDSESTSETLTLFADNVVYDFFLKGPEEITLFDIQRGRIVLLDCPRRVQTTLTTEQLWQFSDAIKSVGTEEGQPGLFNPQFTASFDETSNSVQLSSDQMTYQAKGVKPKQADAAERFRQFADWYARLNAVRPGNPPPFGRLELNGVLASHGLVPEEIERTFVREKRLRSDTQVARSRHLFVWTLSGTDRKRIEKAGECLATFDEVALGQYWRAPTVAARSR